MATRPFSLAEAYGSAQKLAAGDIQLEEAQAKAAKRRTIESTGREAAEKGEYDVDLHAQLLEKSGLAQEAFNLRKIGRGEVKDQADMIKKSLDIVAKSAPLVKQIGQPAWGTFRRLLSQSGLVPIESLPEDYNENTGKLLDIVGAKAQNSIKWIKQQEDPKTGKTSYVGIGEQGQVTDIPGVQAPAKKGMRLTTAGGDVLETNVPVGLQKPIAKAAQEKVISAGESIARMDRIKKNYDPTFLTYGGQIKNWLNRQKSKAGLKLNKEEKQAVKQYRRFSQAVNFEFNAYRKLITGAAAAMSELEMLKKAVISTDLAPEEFESAYNEYMGELTRTVRIRNKLLREGIKPGTKQFGKELDGLYLSGTDDDMGARGDELEAQGLLPEEIVQTLEQEGYM